MNGDETLRTFYRISQAHFDPHYWTKITLNLAVNIFVYRLYIGILPTTGEHDNIYAIIKTRFQGGGGGEWRGIATDITSNPCALLELK